MTIIIGGAGGVGSIAIQLAKTNFLPLLTAKQAAMQSKPKGNYNYNHV